jgi:hypothetical protein
MISKESAMNLRVTLLLVAVIATTAFSTPAGAQWINYPTPGMPRTADGKPDLSGPAPRAADGKPDLSGMWQINGLGYATNITDTPMLPAAEAVFKKRLEAFGHDDPAVGCLPEGPRTGLAGLDPFRIVQTPTLIVILYETGPVRHVYLDGRPHPQDPTPTWMGYSIGRWDGDTLVIDTVGFNDKTWLDFSGRPHSEALRITERLRRVDFGHVDLTITYDDPKTFRKPFTITPAMVFLPDTDPIELVCLENEKDRERLVGRISDHTVPPQIPRGTLAAYVGAYEGPLGAWTVTLDGDRLEVEMADGGGRQMLRPQSDTAFLFQGIGGVVRFVRDASGRATQMVVTVVEGDFVATRK